MRKIFFLLFFTISYSLCSQQSNLKGFVVHATLQKPLYNAHIVNLNSVEGVVTNSKGLFKISASVNDTILISHLGFESIKLKITNDLLKGNELSVALHEKPEEVKEVVVQSTKLIGVLEVDVKMVPQDKFTRVHLSGIPQTYEIGNPKKTTSILEKIFNPIDAVYNLFNKKPKQLKKLKKLKEKDDLRKIFANKYDREVMMEYLELNNNEFNKLLSKCNYSEYFVKKASDLQLIEAILNCYEKHNAIKKGNIKLNKLPISNK